MRDSRLEFIDQTFPIVSDWGDWESQNPQYSEWVNSTDPNTRAILRRLSVINPLPDPGLNMKFETEPGWGGSYLPTEQQITLPPQARRVLENLGSTPNHLPASNEVWPPLLAYQHELTHAVQYGPHGLRLDPELINEQWPPKPSKALSQAYEDLPFLEDSPLSFKLAQERWDEVKKGYRLRARDSEIIRDIALGINPHGLEDIEQRFPREVSKVRRYPGLNNWTEAIEKEARVMEQQADLMQNAAKLPKHNLKYLMPAIAALLLPSLFNQE